MTNKVEYTEKQKKAQALAGTVLICCVVAVIAVVTVKFIIWIWSL